MADALAIQMREKGTTQKALAQEIGCSAFYVLRVLSDDCKPAESWLLKAEQALGGPAGSLVEHSEHIDKSLAAWAARAGAAPLLRWLRDNDVVPTDALAALSKERV